MWRNQNGSFCFIWSIVTIFIIVKIVTIFIIVTIATTNSVSSHLRHQAQSNILLSETFTRKFHFVSWLLIYLLYDSFEYSESNVNPNDIRYQDLVFSIKIQDSWLCSLPMTPHSLDHKRYSTTVTNGNQHKRVTMVCCQKCYHQILFLLILVHIFPSQPDLSKYCQNAHLFHPSCRPAEL